MKPNDEGLQRLLKAASKVIPEAANIPLGLETRVLAQWRAAGTDEDSVSLFAFLRRATVGAGLVLVLSAAWSLARTGPGSAGDEAALLNYDIQTGLTP
jgi:predicted signal transduction protein with EAL and GGDEF domain